MIYSRDETCLECGLEARRQYTPADKDLRFVGLMGLLEMGLDPFPMSDAEREYELYLDRAFERAREAIIKGVTNG